MNNTINGRTPEEIKKGLECCSQNTYTCGEGCPYEIECQRMGRSNDVILDTLAYIQQLERERDEARNDLDTLNYANTELHSAYEAMKRERDAAVERLARYKKCIDCKRYPEVIYNLYCDDCECGSKWQWCGEPLEAK